MSKDPAFLFYSADFLVGVTMTKQRADRLNGLIEIYQVFISKSQERLRYNGR